MWWSLGIGAAGNIAMTLILHTLGPNMMPTSWLGFALILVFYVRPQGVLPERIPPAPRTP